MILHVFANLLLVTFLADALLHLAGSWLAWPITLLECLVLYVVLALTTRLPKRVFLPITFFVFWRATGSLPLPLYLPDPSFRLVSGGLQLALAVGAFGWVRTRTRGRWLLDEQDLPGENASLRNFLWFGLANVLLVVPGVGLYLGGSLALYVERGTEGWMRVGPTGLYAQERDYRRDGRTIRLVAMMHIGDRHFYEEVEESFRGKDVVVLPEGVTDEHGLLENGPRYDKVASALGLRSQSSALDLHGVHVERADVDVSDFHQETIDALRAVGEVFASDDFHMALERFREMRGRWPRDPQVIWDDIVTLRNAAVSRRMIALTDEHAIVVVPWGALHMPGIEEEVLGQGFELAEVRSRRVVSFW